MFYTAPVQQASASLLTARHARPPRRAPLVVQRGMLLAGLAATTATAHFVPFVHSLMLPTLPAALPR